MFGTNGKKETKMSAITTPTSVHALNSIVAGTMVDGTIECESDIRIDGKLKGSLNCDGKVIIGPSGFVDGDIRCEHAVIEGKFEGLLIVKDTLNVKENAHIKGDINTDKLVVHSGASFNVNCNMGKNQDESFADNGDSAVSFVEEFNGKSEE